MKKTLFLCLLLFCVVMLTLVEGNSQSEPNQGLPECYATYSLGGTEEIVKCNGCVMVYNISDKRDGGKCW